MLAPRMGFCMPLEKNNRAATVRRSMIMDDVNFHLLIEKEDDLYSALC